MPFLSYRNSFVEGIGKKNVKGWEGRVRTREEGSGRRRQGRMRKMGKVDPSNPGGSASLKKMKMYQK